MSAMIVWIAIGGAMMYFFDPVSGRERRAWLRDRVDRVTKSGAGSAAAGTTDPQHLTPEHSVAEKSTFESVADPHDSEPRGGRVSECETDREGPAKQVGS